MSKPLTNDVIRATIAGLEEQKNTVDVQIARLRKMLSGSSAAAKKAGAAARKVAVGKAVPKTAGKTAKKRR